MEKAHIAFAASNSYAIGLAVALRSLLEHWDIHRSLSIWILDDGLDEGFKNDLLISNSKFRADINFIRPDLTQVNELFLSRNMGSIVYGKLLLPNLLSSVNKVLGLDTDIIVKADLSELFDTDLQSKPFAAVSDFLLGPGYCNVGVLLMNLIQWRNRDISGKVIKYIKENPEKIKWWDQDGINAVLKGEWLELDPEWNVISESLVMLGWKPGMIKRIQARRISKSAKIIHFVGRYKPWMRKCNHPYKKEFLEILDRTGMCREIVFQA